ncbi:hypothetical protein [Staphylococcus haemolyticus]|uniref:DUF7390 domain-containing protein n=1 Tax=Staphylococcus haemolyticus TaxID=1283 RepID=UPI001E2DCF19|nr:hypothetical protein [Staphylococcus haemolyticus]MCC3722113.1 hypothetical protein [Staphylococcus haemolyticus]
MASFSRLELAKKFRKEIEDWNSMSGLRAEKAMDTVHIQMASLDEMMSAFGYVPRRLPEYPNITDGRFGYVRAFNNDITSLPVNISLEDAVHMHNAGDYRGNPLRRMSNRMAFALTNRIVQQVAIQRDKKWGNDGSGIKSQKKWVEFCDDLNSEYFGIPFDDGLVNKEGE